MTSAAAFPPRPRVPPPASWEFPRPRLTRLGNGVTVLAHDMPGRDTATVLCHLGIPDSAEPDGLGGIASVTAACLLTGARSLPGGEFRQRAAAAGIIWKTEGASTGPVITMELPARNIPQALTLLHLALAEPELDRAAIAWQVQLAAMGIIRETACPENRLLQELPAALYGDAHTASRPAAGTAATVMMITPDAVARFYDANVRPATATVVIAGNLAGLDVGKVAGEAFDAWDDGRPADVPAGQGGQLPPRPPSAVLVNRPGGAQAQLLLAAHVPGRGQPGWAALQVAAHILGSPLTGRLDTQVRERSGHSYGLHARVTELVPGNGLLIVSGAVDGPAAPGVLARVHNILTAPIAGGFTGAEHAAAAAAISGGLPLAFETPGELAAATADLMAGGLGYGYPGRLLGEIAALTAGAVRAAYARHISPRGFTVIAAGHAAVLAGPLRELTGHDPLRVGA